MSDRIRKRCQRCTHGDARKGYRFCWRCLRKLIDEMRRAGYFTPLAEEERSVSS